MIFLHPCHLSAMKIQYFYLVTLTNLIYRGTLCPRHLLLVLLSATNYIFDSNLTQVISESTCIHCSLLDLVIINIPDVIQNITIDKLTSPSDHYIIYFDINLRHSSSNIIQSITKLNYSLSVFDSNSLWTLIKNIIYTECDIYVPKFKILSHSSPKYFTSNVFIPRNVF